MGAVFEAPDPTTFAHQEAASAVLNGSFDLLCTLESRMRDFRARLVHISGERSLTYAELAAHSDALAGHFARTLSEPHSPIALRGNREPELLIGMLAAVKSGHPYLPLDVSIPEDRVEKILRSSGAGAALTPDAIAKILQQPIEPFPLRRMETADPFYILYTSGSSGEPKGVVITLECLTHFVSWLLEEQQFAPGAEIFLNQAPFSFDLSVMDLFGAFATGGTLFSVDRELTNDPALLQNALENSGATVWVSTPSFARLCLFNKRFSAGTLPRLRKFLFCGETLPTETAASLARQFPAAEIWNTYGPTEATVATSSVLITRDHLGDGALPVGRAMTGTQLVIFDENDTPVSDGEPGEIIIAGPNVSPGYFGQPDLTAKSFFKLGNDRAYRTGDFGRLRDGMLFFDGRIDGQVKLRGFRIELGEIEAALREQPSVRDAAVILREDLPGEKRLVGYVVAKSPQPGREIRKALKTKLPEYMVPSVFVDMPVLPLTANGKLDRRALPAPAAPSELSAVPPTNSMEGRLVEIWETLLDVSPIGIRDSFFELGGHSLLAVELVNQIESRFGRKLTLAALFQSPTIEALALVLLQTERAPRWSVLEELRAEGSRPPFFCVPGFLDLARHLGEDQPCYGVHLSELETMPETATAVEDLAERCVTEIRAVQQRGPYFIGGHSFGGVVAFEIAQQLQAGGENVALLALIDPDPPQPHTTHSLRYQLNRYLFHVRKLWRMSLGQRISYLTRSARIERTRMATKVRSLYSPELRRNSAREHAIASSYHAPQYAGKITMFFAQDTHLRQLPTHDPRLEWGKVASDGMEIHEFPGDHYTLIREPNVRRLASKLRTVFDAACAGGVLTLCALDSLTFAF